MEGLEDGWSNRVFVRSLHGNYLRGCPSEQAHGQCIWLLHTSSFCILPASVLSFFLLMTDWGETQSQHMLIYIFLVAKVQKLLTHL